MNKATNYQLPTNSLNQGFTLIEVIVVLGLFAILGAMTAVVGSSDIRGSALHSERDLAVNLLQKTRARAIANIDQLRHGVEIDSDNKQYIVFSMDDLNN